MTKRSGLDRELTLKDAAQKKNVIERRVQKMIREETSKNL